MFGHHCTAPCFWKSKQLSPETPHANCHADLGLFYSHWTQETCSHLSNSISLADIRPCNMTAIPTHQQPDICMVKKEKELKWPSESPDLNSTEMLRMDLKRADHKWMSSDINELKQCCKEDWPKMSSRFILYPVSELWFTFGKEWLHHVIWAYLTTQLSFRSW